MKKSILCCLICATFFSCKTKTNVKHADVFAADIDSTVTPGQDFFQYANGKWIKNNPIPPDESSWGIGNIVYNENQQRLVAESFPRNCKTSCQQNF